MKKLSKIIESIWSDMQDRSSGEIVRKEDLITTNEDLKNKILELYIEQGEGETLDVSSLTKLIKCDDFSYLFINRFKEVKHIIGLEDWDVSKVTNMKGMFYNCKNFNADLSKWDVSNVENMSGMFEECENFNCDLSKWDVSSVRDMDGMFWGCENFNCDLSKWDVSNVENMYGMFWSCINFNSDLSKWDVSNVKNMRSMFRNCENLKCDLSKWDVSNVENMYGMFWSCINFNSDLSKWDVSNVKNVRNMFDDCKSLEQIPFWYTKKGLNESIWSDMQDRSAGEIIRKEDDVNFMSEEDFCDYLNNNYISKYKITYSEFSQGIHIPILNQFTSVLLNISYNYNRNTITMNDDVESLCPELCKMIKKKFKVDKKYVSSHYTQFIIYPPDGSECTNRFFVDVINFIIDNADENMLLIKKKHINESIWSDMQDRSAGITQRKEDDINHLDRDGLFDYIYGLYKQITIHPLPLKSQTSPTHTYFSIPIFKSDYKVYRLNCIFDNNKISEITLMASDADVKDFKQALIDNFNATINSDGALTITTKDGTVSNQVCMDLIKTIVENAPKPYLKKREN